MRAVSFILTGSTLSSLPSDLHTPVRAGTKGRHSPIQFVTLPPYGEEGEGGKKSHYLYQAFQSGAVVNANSGDSCCEAFIFHSADSVSFYCTQELLLSSFFSSSLFFLRNNLSVRLDWEKGNSRGLWQIGASLSCSVNREWLDGRWRDVFLHLKSYRRCYIYIMPCSRLPWRCPFNKGESVAERTFFRGNWIIQVDGRPASSLLRAFIWPCRHWLHHPLQALLGLSWCIQSVSVNCLWHILCFPLFC